MKSWYSAAELMGLPGMPAAKSKVIDKAKRESWKSQPRAGKGGGREYAFLSLPEEAQQHLIRQSTPRVPTQDVAPLVAAPVQDTLPAVAGDPERPLQPVGDLKDWQRSRMEARLGVLMELDRLAVVMGIEKAIQTLLTQAELGQLSPELQRQVPVANARSGGADGSRTLSRRTLYRWLAEREKGHAALAPVPTERRDIPAWVPSLLELYQRPTKPSLAWAMTELPKRLPEGVTPPSYWAACRFLKRMPEIEREHGRHGPRAMRDLRPFRRRDTSQHWPGDIYTMDGHTFDAEVQHPAHKRPFRPEITSCIDVATRKLIGWSIALAESGWAVLDALRHGCVSHGIPAILYVDNGSGYCNALMDDLATGLLSRLSISKETSIPYNSQARGVIERSHRSIWVRAAKTLPTFMGADMDKEARQKAFKITRKQIKEQGVSVLLISWENFQRLADQAVADYNDRPHRGLPKVRDEQTGAMRHQTPNEAWALAIGEGWEPTPVAPEEADDLFRPYQVRKVSRGEINLFGNTYFSQTLADYHGELVRAGYDIHDASRVWVRDRNDRLVCIAEFEGNKSSYFPISAVEDAAARRAKGRQARAARIVEEIEAEHAGILGQTPTASPLTPEQQARAQEALERLRQSQTESAARDQAEAEALSASAQQMLARIAPVEPAPAPIPAGERPIFTTDFSLWLWGEEHPEAVTEQDRAYLAQALSESAALRAQVDAELAKRARRGASSEQ